MATSSSKSGLIIVVIILVAIVGALVLNAPDRRSPGEKIGDAIHELPNGVDKAGRQLQDRTPADKLKDAAKDAGDNVKKSVNQ